MSDNGSLIPLSDEQAKLARDLIGAAKDAVSYVAGIVGDLPRDLVAFLAGDRIKAARAERLQRIWDNARKRLEADGVKEPLPPSMNLALPILTGAYDESREELQDMWSRLLAAAMNPDKVNDIRLEFAEALRKLDPIDVKVLLYLFEHNGFIANNAREYTAKMLSLTEDKFLVSQRNLTNVGIMGEYNSMTSGLLPFGREFLRAMSFKEIK